VIERAKEYIVGKNRKVCVAGNSCRMLLLHRT
jgi:hypothetical protein